MVSQRLLKILLSISFWSMSIALFGQLQVTADQPIARYDVGENMNFVITPAETGMIEYQLFYDRKTPIIQSGTLNATSNQSINLPFSLDTPGIVYCSVAQQGQTDQCIASFAPEKLQAITAEPSDFDSFWNTVRNALSAIPIDPNITLYSENQYTSTYRIDLAQLDNRRVYGFISIPKGAGPFPAIITFPAFGSAANQVVPMDLISERGGAISVSISIHNAPTDQVDPNAYQPDNLNNPDEIYQRYAVAAGLRVIDYLYTRPDFDGTHLGVTGVSQGGGIAVMVAGLDQRVNLLATGNSSHAQHSAYSVDKASGFPHYLWKANNSGQSTTYIQAAEEAIRYFDIIHFAKRYKGPVFNFISHEDEVSLAAAMFAAHNAYTGPKILLNWVDGSHSYPTEYWQARDAFFRRVFEPMRTPPWPWPDPNLGHLIDAGANQSIQTDTAELVGTAELFGTPNPIWSYQWEKVEGPGTVTFLNADQANTKAIFSEAGTYTLSFTAVDKTLLPPSAKYFELSDRIVVQIMDSNGGIGGGGSSSISVTCPEDQMVLVEPGMPVFWPAPTFTTNCPTDPTVALTQLLGPTNGASLLAGAYEVEYEGVDQCGNMQSCAFTLEVAVDPEWDNSQSILFRVEQQGLQAFLQWSSSMGAIEEAFVIERAGQDSIFIPIGTIPSQQIPDVALDYEFIDTSPLTGWNIYRLRQLRSNGTQLAIPPQSLFFATDPNQFMVFPNPTIDNCYFHVRPAAGKAAQLRLVDQLGKVWLSQSFDELTDAPLYLDLKGFTPGVYTLILEPRRFPETIVRKVVVVDGD